MTVSLRVFSDDLEPAEVSKILSATPSESRRAGDPTNARSGPTHFDRGAWFLRSDSRDREDLEGQIRSILATATSDLARWAELNRRFAVDLFCGVFLEDDMNQGVSLSPEILRELGARGIHVEMDLYGSDGSQDS